MSVPGCVGGINLEEGRVDTRKWFTLGAGKKAKITTSGGSGDVDLQVKRGEDQYDEPSAYDYDCKSMNDANDEECEVGPYESESAITLRLVGYDASYDVTLCVEEVSDSASECVGFDQSCTPNESNCCDVDGSKSECSEYIDGYYCFPVEPISARHEGSNLDQIRKGILVYSSIFC